MQALTSALLTRISCPWQRMKGLNAFNEEKNGKTGRHLLKGKLCFQMVKKTKTKTQKLIFLHGFFLFQDKKDSLARVEK